jgi:hypothetical protein
MSHTRIGVDQLEAAFRQGRNGYAWEDLHFRRGGDIDRLLVRSEGEGEFGGGLERAEVQVLWSRAVSPFFDLLAAPATISRTGRTGRISSSASRASLPTGSSSTELSSSRPRAKSPPASKRSTTSASPSASSSSPAPRSTFRSRTCPSFASAPA